MQRTLSMPNDARDKVIGILQPMYLPWAGYFEQIALVDHFVLMDDVQYTKRDWRNRNRIKTGQGTAWLTVPVKRSPLDSPINAIEIDYGRDWVKKHLRTIEVNYRRCPHFQPLFAEISQVLIERPRRLVTLNTALIRTLMAHLDIDTSLSYSSAVPYGAPNGLAPVAARNARILELCRYHNAGVLYDGKRAADFIDTALFAANDVRVVFQDYRPAPYPQAFGTFVSHLSALDLIMNAGPEAGRILRESPAPDLGRATSAVS